MCAGTPQTPRGNVSIRQHTSAYVSIRQHTSAYVSIVSLHVRRNAANTSASGRPSDARSGGNVRIRQHTSAYVSIRQHTPQTPQRRVGRLVQEAKATSRQRRRQLWGTCIHQRSMYTSAEWGSLIFFRIFRLLFLCRFFFLKKNRQKNTC
jgi:hypothetical protein